MAPPPSRWTGPVTLRRTPRWSRPHDPRRRTPHRRAGRPTFPPRPPSGRGVAARKTRRAGARDGDRGGGVRNVSPCGERRLPSQFATQHAVALNLIQSLSNRRIEPYRTSDWLQVKLGATTGEPFSNDRCISPVDGLLFSATLCLRGRMCL